MSKMPNKRKICTENLNSNQSIYIASLNSYYQPESVLNSAYRKVLDFKENAEKILEKEKSETLNLNDFAKAILDSRSFEISLQHNCIKLKCYITLEKDKDTKKKRNEQQNQHTPPGTPLSTSSTPQYNHVRTESTSSYYGSESTSYLDQFSPIGKPVSSGGAKKVNVEVIMKSNPFRVEENEKTTRMELIRTENGVNGDMLRFTYYSKPECEKYRESNSELYENGRLVVFTNDFFTVTQDRSSGEMNISLNEIVQSKEEQIRTEALGEKLFLLLKDRPRHRALLTNECKLNHSLSSQYLNSMIHEQTTGSISLGHQTNSLITTQEDETFYTRELINIYGQPIVPSFHKHFNYQLSNTHYGYRTLRRLLNCDILKKYVKITKEEIKSLDRVVEFVQLTPEKCLSAFQLNITSFYDPFRFENGIVKNWLDVWYVERLKEKYAFNDASSSNCISQQTPPPSASLTPSMSSASSLCHSTTSWSMTTSDSVSVKNSSHFLFNTNNNTKSNCFLHTSNCCSVDDTGNSKSSLDDDSVFNFSECDQANHLWFCLKDYSCDKMEEFVSKLKDYIQIRNNRSDLILIHTAHPLFEYKDVLAETRRILAIYLNKSTVTKSIDELISSKFPVVAREHIEHLLTKFLNIDDEKKIVGFTALFEILMILKRELAKEKNDEMKYSHFLCTLERANQEKLKMAIVQLKCVPCLNKFTTNFNLVQQSSSHSQLSLSSSHNSKSSMVSHANMSRLLKQMSLIVSTELQQIAIDLVERINEDKPVKFIRLKEEFRHVQVQQQSSSQSSSITQAVPQFNKSPSQPISIIKPTSTQVKSTDSNSQLVKQQHQQINSIIQMKKLTASFAKKLELCSMPSSKPQAIFNPKKDLQQFMSQEQKSQTLASYRPMDRTSTNTYMYSERY